jgi:hypothetical protein
MTKFFNNFWKKRSLIDDPDISSHYKKDETINYDIKFIKKYLKPNFTVLDLGCGPMRTVSKIYKSCKHIDCVDFQSKYVEMHKKYKNTKGFVKPVQNFTIDKKYDLIIIFGVFTFFKKNEIKQTLKNLESMRHSRTIILIKDQCGLFKDVFIDKYSNVIGSRYKAYYHYYKNNKKMYSNKFKTKIFSNIYPKKLNKFINTKTFFFKLTNN